MNTELEQNDTRPTPRERAYSLMYSRLEDLHAFNSGNYDPEEIGEPNEYGLCIDMVEAGTFENQCPYIRFQISWGGPSEEFRFYSDGSASFVFMDWSEYEEITLYRDDRETVEHHLGIAYCDNLTQWAEYHLRDFDFDAWFDRYLGADEDE